MATGVIHWLDVERRFGFLRDSHHRSFFFHQSALPDATHGRSRLFDLLTPGQRVTFSEVMTERGLRAEDVRLVDDGDAAW